MREDAPTILVTGASGFVGRHVMNSLEGHARAVPAVLDGRRVNLLDARDREELLRRTRPDVLIHLAWFTQHGKFWTAPENALWEAASIDLFERFYAEGGERVVGTGSCAEYDWAEPTAAFIEDAPLAPSTPYGAAKVRLADGLSEQAARFGCSWAWARIFFSFGPDEPEGRLLPLMRRAVKSRARLEIGPGSTVRDFWPVQTLGAAIAALALSQVQGPVNTASGRALRFDELAAMIEDLADARGTISPDRRSLGSNEPERLVADTSRLTQEVGFREQPDLRAALEEYLND